MAYELITLEGFGRALERVGDLFPELVIKSLQRTAFESRTILTKTIRDTMPYAPIDTGAYMRAWTRVKFPDGADIVNEAFVAPIIELGARPHPPSRAKITALTEWALRKSRAAVPKKKKSRKTRRKKASGFFGGGRTRTRKKSSRKRRRRSSAVDPDARTKAESWAWAIARKHEKFGMAGKEILGRSWPKIVKLAEVNLDEDLKRAARIRW